MQRQRADRQRWKCRVKCVRRRSQRAGVLSASPAAGAGRHTWHCAQATPADVSLVSQLCVCVSETQTPTRTLCEENDLCNKPPSPRVYLYHTPFPSSCFHCHFHHCDGHGEASVTTIWYDKMWHYTHVASLGMKGHRLPARGKDEPRMGDCGLSRNAGQTDRPAERQLIPGITGWVRGKD